MTITSVSNPSVKAARALKAHKARHESGLHLAEGPKALYEIAQFGVTLSQAFCTEAFAEEHAAMLAHTGAQVFAVSQNVLEAISDTRTPQGAVFVVKTPVPSEDKLCAGNPAAETPDPGKPAPRRLILALDAVQDPGNLGTLLRAADAFGASRVLLGEGCAEAFSPKAVRASAFSCYHIPVYACNSLYDDLTALKRDGFRILAADVHGEEGFPALGRGVCGVCIVAGSEGAGLREDIAALCERVRLPMPGRAESLNVALATGIFLYEAAGRM